MRSNFSQALDLNSCNQPSQKLRPKDVCDDTLANEGMGWERDQEEFPEEWNQEGRAIPGKKSSTNHRKRNETSTFKFISPFEYDVHAVCRARLCQGHTSPLRKQRAIEEANSRRFDGTACFLCDPGGTL